jgi:uncharacterized RDD family membrane protein YckC
MIFMSLPVGFALSYMLGQWNLEPEDFIRLVMAPGPMTPLQAWVETVAVVLQVLYAGYFIGRHGRTPGQRLFRLEVVDGNGQLVGWGQAWLRAVAGTISQAVMMLGYIIAPFLPQKRTWHDFVARTYVVRRY